LKISDSRDPPTDETQPLPACLDNQEKLLGARRAEGKKIVAPDGYGTNPQVGAELDQLYHTLYGRGADRYEKAALVSFVEKQQKAATSKTDDSAKAKGEVAIDPHAARAAAFVDLAHALANSNEFSYRF
jgi:hypothetical protein